MNILHLFCDQLRADCFHALGNTEMKTPNIDKLIGMGVAFENCYTASPVCVAGRCSMITGQYPTKTKCYANDNMPETKSFMDVLKENGYKTHGIGKCHFTPDSLALRGFDSRERLEEGDTRTPDVEPYYSFVKESGYKHVKEPNGTRGEMYYIPQNSSLPEDVHPTGWVGDRTCAFINENKGDQDWYLFSSFLHPHPPFCPPDPWHRLYRTSETSAPNIPENFEELQMFINKVQNRYKYRDNGYDENFVLTMRAYYFACISFVDYQIGKILHTLEETGQMDNTLIVLSADHGEMLGDFKCFGKRSMHDSCARIPMIVYKKGEFEGGKICNAPASLTDLAATFTSGMKHECDFEGEDLRDVLSGETSRKYVYSFFSAHEDAGYAQCELPAENRIETLMDMMVKDEKFKYAYSVPDRREFLFVDHNENYNAIADEVYAEDVKRLKKALMDKVLADGVDMLVDGDDWRKFDYVAEVPKDKRKGLLRQDNEIEWYND